MALQQMLQRRNNIPIYCLAGTTILFKHLKIKQLNLIVAL